MLTRLTTAIVEQQALYEPLVATVEARIPSSPVILYPSSADRCLIKVCTSTFNLKPFGFLIRK